MSTVTRMLSRWRPYWLLFALAAASFWRLWLTPDGFLYPPGSDYSDLTITHWPNALYIRHSLSTWGQVPLWRHLIMSGGPFVANPLSGLWYPPNMLLLLLPLTCAFNLLFILQTAWAGWGAYRLARSVGASLAGSLLAALTVMLTPKALAHLASGHVGLYYAWTWVPWVLWAVQRLARRGRPGDVATAAATLGMLILADVRMGLYVGVAAAGYWLVNLKSQIPNVKTRVAAGIGACLLAATLVAVQVIPLAMVAGRLNRGGLSLEESGAFSLPPRYLLGLAIADHSGFSEWMTYVGVAGLLLACVGVARWRGNERWWWLGMALSAAFYSLGTHTPLYTMLHRLFPPLQWLRGPARAWFLVAMAVAVLAAKGLAALEMSPFRARNRFLRVAAAGLVGATVAGVGGGLALGLPINVVVAAGLWPLVGALIALRGSGRLQARPFARLMLVVALMDLWVVGFTLHRVRPAQEVLAEGQAAAEWLAQQERPFRIYSPSYSIPHHTGAIYGIESADGVDPFQLADYATFMRSAAGVDISDYSVTVPPFPQVSDGEDMLLALRDVAPDLSQLGLLDVRYVVAAYPMDIEGLVALGERDGVYLYRNESVLPRVYVRGKGGESWDASPVEWTPNRIVIDAQGPGLLVLSEVYDPDWRVTVDESLAPVLRVDGILRGVYLEQGMHRAEFTYWPQGLGWGIGVTSVALVSLLALWGADRRLAKGRCPLYGGLGSGRGERG